MFEQLWNKLRGEPAAQSGDNRRAHERHPVSVRTTCHQVSDGAAVDAVEVKDISRGGMRFLTSRKMEPGTLIRVNLPGVRADESSVLACVMHSTAQSGGAFAIGCAFSDELHDDDLRHFGARREPSKTDDRRIWARFPTKGTVDYVVLPPTGAAAKQAEIVNISATGIGLILDDRIEPGTMLDLLLKTADGATTFDILACVVFLGRRSEGGWMAGCHFVRELDETDVKRLV